MTEGTPTFDPERWGLSGSPAEGDTGAPAEDSRGAPGEAPEQFDAPFDETIAADTEGAFDPAGPDADPAHLAADPRVDASRAAGDPGATADADPSAFDAGPDATVAELQSAFDLGPAAAGRSGPSDAASAGTPAEHEGAVPFPVPDDVADQSPEELAAALAAVCFALNRPVILAEAAAILGRSEATIAEAADHLAGTLRSGGLMLQRHQNEIQVVTRPEVAWAVQRALNPEKPGRLSRAATETLAIVAYRQPLTRAAVEAIRGVNCEAVLDSLERRGLIAEVGRQDSPGHPRLFGTTLRFLQVVGLERIEDLPPLPEGLKVPELPAAGWDIAAGDEPDPEAAPQPDEPAGPGDAGEAAAIEVRGEPVHTAAADPDEGYGDDADDDGVVDAIEAAFDPAHDDPSPPAEDDDGPPGPAPDAGR